MPLRLATRTSFSAVQEGRRLALFPVLGRIPAQPEPARKKHTQAREQYYSPVEPEPWPSAVVYKTTKQEQQQTQEHQPEWIPKEP